MLLYSLAKKKTGSVFPASCHATFHHALIKRCNVSRDGREHVEEGHIAYYKITKVIRAL